VQIVAQYAYFLKRTELSQDIFAEDFCIEVTTHQTFLNYH